MTEQKLLTDDYRLAMGGEGPQAAQWKDKPHRLVYDLCREVDRLQQRVDAGAEALLVVAGMESIRGRLFIQRDPPGWLAWQEDGPDCYGDTLLAALEQAVAVKGDGA